MGIRRTTDRRLARLRADGARAVDRSAAVQFRRVLIALVALYALALQGVLGGMAATAASAPEHALCLSGDGSPGAAPSQKHLPAHGHLACCAAAHVAMPIATVAPAPVAIRPARRASAAPPPYPVHVAAPRAPPGAGPSPRAPPAA